MAVKFKPTGDRVLVQVLAKDGHIDGVLIPDSSKEDARIGIIVAVGESPVYIEGDQVLFGAWAGKEIAIEGVPFRVLREGEIDGKLIDAGP